MAKRLGAAQQAGDGPKNLVPDKTAKERLILIKIPIVDFLVALLYFFMSLFVAPKKNKSQDDKIITVNWLKDLLPREIPHARIMTFNYTSRWHRNAPKQSRNSCAELFLFSLRDLREEV